MKEGRLARPNSSALPLCRVCPFARVALLCRFVAASLFFIFTRRMSHLPPSTWSCRTGPCRRGILPEFYTLFGDCQ